MGSNTVCYWSMAFSTNVVKCISDTFPVVSISYNSIMHIQHKNRLLIKRAINLWLGTFKKCWGNCIHNDVIFQLLPFLFLVVLLVLKLAECLHCPDSIHKRGSLKWKKSHLWCRTQWEISTFTINVHFIKIPLRCYNAILNSQTD